ncbi:hypothetical protein HMPREF9123_2332 [Neisseria bacilliformis ATCC BAA-1200]|uniref:Uncharacterized protein n=1 Tax=Neisseria bacilliformis ATCC BAA-1200 TaxID=888742 RepID=F2BF25_9NEIS|nr:hypothetical protein HMPREF9123_2332 [Neisseria bacilliformis ATCC BAA-1200]
MKRPSRKQEASHSEKQISDGLCHLSRVCHSKAMHAVYALQQMPASGKP